MAILRGMNDNRGLSLLDVLVASTLLFIVVLAAGRMITVRRLAVNASREKIVAVNLAREGIELVRGVRDSNWFAERPWSSSLCDPGVTDTVDVTYDSAMARNEESFGDTLDTVLYTTSFGEWVHDSGGTTATPYSRVLTIECANHEADPAFIRVISTVTWGNNTLPIQEDLYDWLPDPNPS